MRGFVQLFVLCTNLPFQGRNWKTESPQDGWKQNGAGKGEEETARAWIRAARAGEDDGVGATPEGGCAVFTILQARGSVPAWAGQVGFS